MMADVETLKEAKRLAASPESCIKKVENQLTLLIHPMYFSDLLKGVFQELNSLTRRYSRLRGGAIMAYENVQLVSSHGWLFDTNPFNHIIIRAQFYVFSPEVGSILEGVVKKKTVNHIGCLVHGKFNVSVPRPVDISVDEWCETVAEEGEPVKLTVTHVNMKNFFPYIVAELYPKRIKELVYSRTKENGYICDTTDGALKQNSRIIFDDDSGISVTEAQESLVNAEKEEETVKQITSSECKRKIGTNERTSEEKINSKKRKRQDEYFDKNQDESVMVSTKKKKKNSVVEEIINMTADEEFKGSNRKTTKKRKKQHCVDPSTNENIDLEQNTIEELRISEHIVCLTEDEVQMPILRTSKDKLKKSRNGNKQFSPKNNEEKESRNDWNAHEEFQDIGPKSTKKRKKKHYVDHSVNEVGLQENSVDRLQIPNENIDLEQNTNEELHISEDIVCHTEDEVQMPILLRTSKNKLKKSRNGNKKFSHKNNKEKESRNDWNAHEEFQDISRKSTKKRKKKHYADHSINEMGPKENSVDRLQIPEETEYHKDNETQIPIVSGTNEVIGNESKNGNKKLRRNIEKKDSVNSPRVKETHITGSIKNSLPLLTKSVEVNLASPEQTSTTRSSSSKKLKNSNIASQRKKKISSVSQEQEGSSIITAKRNTKSSSSGKSKRPTEFENMFADLFTPDLDFD